MCLPEGEDGWLVILGVGAPTQVMIEIHDSADFGLRFKVLKDKNEWSEDNLESTDTGDGTVPFEGALPQFLEKERVVCVCPEDFSRWEIRDRFLAKQSGFHGFLPAVNLVQRLVIRFFREDYGGHVWGWKPPTVNMSEWTPPGWLERRPD